jgi:hypothetical protein
MSEPQLRHRGTVLRGAAVLAALVAAGPSCSMAARSPSREAIDLGKGLQVDRACGEVRIDAEVACDRGWLEQAVCAAGTRDHEALLAVRVPASRIHAALLLLGAGPGAPGRWEQAADGSVERIAPSGEALEILVRLQGRDRPLSDWVHDPVRGRPFPEQPWVFAGSRELADAGTARGLPSYAADRSGSVVGIVTFGDETIAFREVLSDRAEVDAPAWQARTGAMPAAGTPVTLVVRRAPRAEAAP